MEVLAFRQSLPAINNDCCASDIRGIIGCKKECCVGNVTRCAKAAERNDSNVHTEVSRLEELGLIDRNEENTIFVPCETVEILLPLAQVA